MMDARTAHVRHVSAGDYKMEYHDHDAPFREGYGPEVAAASLPESQPEHPCACDKPLLGSDNRCANCGMPWPDHSRIEGIAGLLAEFIHHDTDHIPTIKRLLTAFAKEIQMAADGHPESSTPTTEYPYARYGCIQNGLSQTDDKQRMIDISNLEFYARLFKENRWEVREIHWSVFHETLLAIAKRLKAVEPQPNGLSQPSPSGDEMDYEKEAKELLDISAIWHVGPFQRESITKVANWLRSHDAKVRQQPVCELGKPVPATINGQPGSVAFFDKESAEAHGFKVSYAKVGPAEQRLRTLLRDLCHQVRISNAVDDHGHALVNLKALHDAEAALQESR